MPTHRPNDPDSTNGATGQDLPSWSRDATSDKFTTQHQGGDAESNKIGYELADANVSGAATFLVVLGVSVAVVFVLSFGIGKLINMELTKQDGPPSKWSQLAGVKPQYKMESNPQMEQQQLQQMVKRFPTPRLQADDGNMAVANMHAREDMLLNHYSWANQQTQEVRIPITRAMELLAQKGLPVENQAVASQQAMFGDGSKTVTAPLTDGFARTGPELQMIEARDQRLQNGPSEPTQAQLQPGR